VAKQGGRLVGELSCDVYGRHFDPSDVGFIERQDVAHCFESIGWHDADAGGWFEETQHNLEVFHRYDLAGQPIGSGYQLNTWGRLRSAWRYFAELHWRPAHLDDREVGDGTALERAGLVGWESSLHSDPRLAVAVGLGTTVQWLADGRHVEADAVIGLRLHPQLDLELLPSLLYAAGEPRYVGDEAGRHRFARERAVAVSGTLRATYTFSTRLSLQAYGQLFVDRVSFSDFSTSTPGDREVELGELAPAAAPAEPIDFADGSLALSALARWEVRPGSVAHLVLSHAQTRAEAGAVEGLPTLSILRAPAATVLLLKLSWWFG
jgi:hypothetical protein